MEGYGEHLYGIDKDDIMQHRDNASATKIIGKHGTLKKTTLFRFRWSSLIPLCHLKHKKLSSSFALSWKSSLYAAGRGSAFSYLRSCLLAESNDRKRTSSPILVPGINSTDFKKIIGGFLNHIDFL
jgi:hypothetical protein